MTTTTTGRRRPQGAEAPDPGRGRVVHRVVWNLPYPGAPRSSRRPRSTPATRPTGPLVPPGKYTVRLTVDGQAQTAEAGRASPTRACPADLTPSSTSSSCKSATTSPSWPARCNNCGRSASSSNARNELLDGDAKAEPLVKASKELIAKLDALEEKLHNPKAKVAYDILAAKGGAEAVLAIRVRVRSAQGRRRPADAGHDATSTPTSRPNWKS